MYSLTRRNAENTVDKYRKLKASYDDIEDNLQSLLLWFFGTLTFAVIAFAGYQMPGGFLAVVAVVALSVYPMIRGNSLEKKLKLLQPEYDIAYRFLYPEVATARH